MLYGLGVNLHVGTGPGGANSAGCSVACLEWTCGMAGSKSWSPRPRRMTFCRLKARLQKRIGNCWHCRGKLLGCLFYMALWGLRCELSGNPVTSSATRRTCRKGKPPAGDGRVHRGENLLDLKPQYLLRALPPISFIYILDDLHFLWRLPS